MHSAHNRINYRFAIAIPGGRLRRSILLFDPRLNGSGGIDPGGMIRKYPRECLKLLPEWVEIAEHGEQLAGTVIVQTWRNLIQNRRCVAHTRKLGLCQSADEHAEQSTRPYYGISFLNNGLLRADTYDAKTGLAEDVLQFGGGIPVLWNGRVWTIEQIAPEVADFGHIWRLQVSSTTGTLAKDKQTFNRLRIAFDETCRESAGVAAERLFAVAREASLHGEPLARERTYLHNLVGVRQDGGLVSLVATGSLEELGELAQRAGAVSAIIVDNGGSCCLALRRGMHAELRTLAESYYHRPLSIAVAFFELTGEPETTYFTGDPFPFTKREAVSIVTQRSPFEVPLEFDTDRGIVRRIVSVPDRDSASADTVALTIANFATIYGAHRAAMLTPPDFAAHVRSRFSERFHVTPKAMDDDGQRGLWLEDYLGTIYAKRFEILDASLTAESNVQRIKVSADSAQAAAEWSLGIDIGAENIKCVLLDAARGVVHEPKVPTTPTKGYDGQDYDSKLFKRQLKAAVAAALDGMQVDLNRLNSIGLSWPGAVRDGIAAHSKVVLDMADMFPDGPTGHLNVTLFNEIRDLPRFLRLTLGVSDEVSIATYNDGEVEVAYEARTSRRTGVLLCKLGTTVAGAFLDRSGDYRYLTELGRCVIRTDDIAPRHKFSRIQGWASLLIGSGPLAERSSDRGIAQVNGKPISPEDAGRELSLVIESHSSGEETARSILDEMGRYIADLLAECEYHLGEVDHILLRGGPMGDHTVGRLLRESVLAHLPPATAMKVDPRGGTQHSGAFAAAWLAARE